MLQNSIFKIVFLKIFTHTSFQLIPCDTRVKEADFILKHFTFIVLSTIAKKKKSKPSNSTGNFDDVKKIKYMVDSTREREGIVEGISYKKIL